MTTTSTLRDPLTGHGRQDANEISERLSVQVDNLQEMIQKLEGYYSRIEAKDDNRNLRKKMKEEQTQINIQMNQAFSLLKELDDLPLRKAEDKAYRDKIGRRVRDNLNKQSEKFKELLKKIHVKEKIFIESKKSMYESRVKSSNVSEGSNDEEQELAADMEDLDFTEAMLKEREAYVQEVRRYAYEVNKTAQTQALILKDGSEVIEVIEEDTNIAEKKTAEGNKQLEEALKHQKKASKRNIIICLVVIFVCVIILAITLSNIL
jgi:t-SNARE complex subunit (syntaxin)